MTNLLMLLSITLSTNTVIKWYEGGEHWKPGSQTQTAMCYTITKIHKDYIISGTLDETPVNKIILSVPVSVLTVDYKVTRCIEWNSNLNCFIETRKLVPFYTNTWTDNYFVSNCFMMISTNGGHGSQIIER